MENALANSDLSSRLALSAVNMEQSDYDSRTALHIAAAEGDTLSPKYVQLYDFKWAWIKCLIAFFRPPGHVEAVIFLTDVCKVNPNMKDR